MSQRSTELKAPKVHEIINWLLSNEPLVPHDWIMVKSKMVTTVPYISEQLWALPQITWYLNKHINNLHNIPDPIDTLILLKKIFIAQKITKLDLFNVWFNFKVKLEEAIEEVDSKDTNDARGKALMMRQFNIPLDRYIKPAATKANIKKNSDPEIKKIIQVAITKEQEPKIDENRGVYLKELSQEIIDREELILFDVSLLKKANKVLFIFIDKNNHKKYYLQPFTAKIFISKQDGVINNDYIEELTADKFNGFILKDIKLYMKLKYMLNDSYKRIINGVHN